MNNIKENNKIKTFYTEYSFEFEEYLDSFLVDLTKSNSQYYNIITNIELLKTSYPKVRDLFDNDIESSLTTEEVSAIIKIKNLEYDKNTIENKELFFRGKDEFENLRKL